LFQTTVTVSQILEETPEVKTLRLDLPEGSDFRFRPGQSVRLGPADAANPHRHYAIASSPLEASYLEVAVERPGSGTGSLFSLRGGDPLVLSGPFGSWSFRDEDRLAILICSGAAIAPLRSIIRYVLDKGLPSRLALFYSAAAPSRIVFRRELEQFSARGVLVHTTITEPSFPEEEGLWEGPTGPLKAAAIRRAVPDYLDAVYYLCGPSAMLTRLRPQLRAIGVPDESVRAETWWEA